MLDNDFELDRGAARQRVWGGFYQFPKTARGDTVEVYGFDADAKGTAADRCRLLGHLVGRHARVPRAAKGRWNYEVEAVAADRRLGRQRRRRTQRIDLDHRAHLLHFEVGYQFDTAWAPNLMFQYDDASGDEDPFDGDNERFNTLFGDRRFDLRRRDLWPVQSQQLARKGCGSRWRRTRAARNAALPLVSARRRARQWVGIGARDPTGRAGDSLGRQLEGSITWAAIPDRLSIEAGFEHLWFGRFAHETGVSVNGDPTYFYLAATTRF